MSYSAIYRMLDAGQIKEAKAFSRHQVERELFAAWRDGQIKLPDEQAEIDAKNMLEAERQAVLLEAKAEIEAQEAKVHFEPLPAPSLKAITPDSCRKVFPASKPTEAAVSSAPAGEQKPYKGESIRVNPARIQELLKQRGCQNRSQMAYYLGFPAVSSIPNILGIIEPGRTTKTLYGQYLIDILGPEISAE